MRLKMFLLLFSFQLVGFAQQYEYVYRNTKDSSYNAYVIVVPNDTKIKGVIIRDYSRLPDMKRKSPYRWGALALENSLAILYTNTTNYFPELYYDETGQQVLDEILEEVIVKYKIPRDCLFIGGISASGTRALRFTQFCAEGKSKYGHKIKGVFAVDSPIDNERFYNSATLHGANFKGGMKSEAEMMQRVYLEKFGGSPAENPFGYLESSVFSASQPDKSNAKHFLKTDILLIHEPDIDWWLHERGASYYDINSYDLVGFSQSLIKMGHSSLELITTTGKGFDRQGNRNCHSWTIVDEEYLIQWIVNR